MGEDFTRAGDAKAAFFQHAQRGEIVFGDVGVERSGGHQYEKRSKRAGGNAQAPELPAEPAAHLRRTEPGMVDDKTGYLPAVEDGADDQVRVSQGFLPEGVEGGPVGGVFGSEGRHADGGGIKLLLEEDVQVGGKDQA